MNESGLLARSIWVISTDGKIAYRELVADQGQEPDNGREESGYLVAARISRAPCAIRSSASFSPSSAA